MPLPASVPETFETFADRFRAARGKRLEEKRVVLEALAELKGLLTQLRVVPEKNPSKLLLAKRFLVGYLGTTLRESKAVYREAAKEGHKAFTVKRALKDLGVRRIDEGCRKEHRVYLILSQNFPESLLPNENLHPNEKPSPGLPTRTRPGTEKKEAIMQQRAELQEPVVNRKDRDLGPRDEVMLLQYSNRKPKGRKLKK